MCGFITSSLLASAHFGTFQHFKLLFWLSITDEGSDPEMTYGPHYNYIRFKMYTYKKKSLFEIQKGSVRNFALYNKQKNTNSYSQTHRTSL